MPALTPGNSGHTLQLSITERAGDRREQPSSLTEAAAQPVAASPDPPRQAEETLTRITSNGVTGQHRAPRPVRKAVAAPARSATVATETVAATATVASNPVLQREETDRHLRNSVMELVSRELTYPVIARRKGWQGIVKLELHIEADGSITDLQLAETSGYSILDRAAMQCLQFASLPGAAHWLQGQTIDIVVPVEYRLVDS